MKPHERLAPDACDLAGNTFTGMNRAASRSAWLVGRRGFLGGLIGFAVGSLFCRRGLCTQNLPGAPAMFCRKIPG